jgi:hypothetical protein
VGVYNLLHVEMACRRCGDVVPRVLQFKYGAGYLYDYHVGDDVSWASGGARILNRGRRTTGPAWVPAYAERPCPHCGDEATFADFAVIVHGNRLLDAVQAPLGFHFREDQDIVPLSPGEQPSPVRTDR